MKPLFYICLLLGLCTQAFSQTGRLTGTVMDSATNTPLELATVAILGQDSLVVAYQLSDKNGMFTIEKLPVGKSLLASISYTGYNSYHTSLQLDPRKTDTLVVHLTLNNNDSLGVVVTAAIPIRMNGDTLEINPDAFKMKGDAVVEELLNQISGITIWSDGTITVNGRKVQNLFVNGQSFMGSTDPRVATQNLPKSAIEKIQLYQEYDRSKIGQEKQPQDSLLTMNIKLKDKSNKGYFGKAGVGYGTSDRFESDLSFQVYSPRTSYGIGGGLNNINKNIGNLQDMFQNNTYRNYNPNLYNVGRFGTNGINRNHSIGAVLVHSFIESANNRQNDRITLNYNKSGVRSYLTDLSLQNRTTVDNPQFIRDQGIQNNQQDKHDIALNYIKTNSYSDQLSLNGLVSTNVDKANSTRFSEVRDSLDQLQSTNRITYRQNQRSDNESLNASFSKSSWEEPLKSFNINVNARRGNATTERDVASVFESFTDISKSVSNNRHYLTHNQSMNVSGSLDYGGFRRLLFGRFNLFGINLSLNQWFSYSRVLENNVVSDYDTTSKLYVNNANLTNKNKRETKEYSPSLQLSKYIYKYTDVMSRSLNVQFKFIEDFKIDKNGSSFAKRNLDRSFQFFRYEGNLGYQYQKRNKYRYNTSISYTKQFEYPSIDRLYTIVDDINAYDIRVGNPYLKNITSHNINLNGSFNIENPKSLYSINGNIYGGYSLMLDPVTDSIINDLSGKRTYYYINADRSNNSNLNYSFNIARRLKKSTLQFMYNGQFRANKTPNYIDGVSNTSKTRNINNQFTLQLTLRSILVINLQQSLQRSINTPSAAQLSAFKNRNNTTKLGVVLNYPANFSFSSTIDRIGSSNVNKPIYLWNIFATYRFMKQQGELKFSAMDLLKQYENISNSANAYGTTTRITNGLQQYFLLTFSYYPRKFGKTEVKKQTYEQKW